MFEYQTKGVYVSKGSVLVSKGVPLYHRPLYISHKKEAYLSVQFMVIHNLHVDHSSRPHVR